MSASLVGSEMCIRDSSTARVRKYSASALRRPAWPMARSTFANGSSSSTRSSITEDLAGEGGKP
eukprot:4030839-Alexandrium_andersonii.AAC.1